MFICSLLVSVSLTSCKKGDAAGEEAATEHPSGDSTEKSEHPKGESEHPKGDAEHPNNNADSTSTGNQ